ncbi:nucleotidyltransferase family protein [uncultured Amaricoccus sp.]|uniref:nucleotidyltransferase family protein n=1 Tax=uncultured Amaricoccus sp. TaxID=339341 RepID=UPI00260D8070|nr:nucleotidyltransferase family protein [uncultured Amaricoccus sp.]
MTAEAGIIFAAGLGTRMGALTRTRPKALIEVAGRPLIDHALSLYRGAGVRRIVVNAHAHAEQLRTWLAEAAPEARISYEPRLLETGGGLQAARPLLGPGPVLTLNADMVWGGENPIEPLRAAWDPARMDALLCLVPRAAALGHTGAGDFHRAADGRLTRRGADAAADFVYAGAGILGAEALAGLEGGVYSLNAVWDPILAAGRMFGIVHRGVWADVGRPEGIALAEKALAR